MNLHLKVLLAGIITAFYIFGVHGTTVVNSTVRCTQSEVRLDTLRADYTWTLNGLPKFLIDDLNLRSWESRLKTEFVVNTSYIKPFDTELPGVWKIFFYKERNESELHIGMKYMVFSTQDKNLTIQSDLALTVGEKTIFAPRYSHIDSFKNYSEENIRKLKWSLSIDQLIQLIDEGQPQILSTTPPTTGVSSDSAIEYPNNQLIFTFAIKASKVRSTLSNGKGDESNCEQPSFESRLTSERNKGNGISKFYSASTESSGLINYSYFYGTSTPNYYRNPNTTPYYYYNPSSTSYYYRNPNTTPNYYRSRTTTRPSKYENYMYLK